MNGPQTKGVKAQIPYLMNRDNDIPCLSSGLSPNELRQRPRTEIGWGRLDTNLWEHESAALHCGLLVLLDHLTHPGELAGDIEIMRPGLRTHLERLLSVGSVRPNRGDKDIGTLSQSRKLLLVLDVHYLDSCS